MPWMFLQAESRAFMKHLPRNKEARCRVIAEVE
jgi:hypothetical protein